jgi:hypothetical protein
MTFGTPEYVPIMALGPVLSFVVTVVVTVTGTTTMPVDQLRMS